MHNHAVEDKDYRLWALLHQTRSALFKVRERDVSKYGITATQSAVLFVIGTIGENATIGQIARWLVREPHTMSNILMRMEKMGLINRVRNKNNRTEIIISLTKKGKEVHDKLMNDIVVIQEMMSCLSEEEYEFMYSCLKKLRDKALNYYVKIRDVPYP